MTLSCYGVLETVCAITITITPQISGEKGLDWSMEKVDVQSTSVVIYPKRGKIEQKLL